MVFSKGVVLSSSTRKPRYMRRKKLSRSARRKMIKPKYNIRGRFRLSQPVHYFTRFQNGGTIQATIGVAPTYGVTYWQLDQVPGYAEFTAMYDFYKINAVQVKYIPISNITNTTLGSRTDFYNRFISVIDYNDRAVPSSLDSLRQYSNCKVTPNLMVHKRFLHPRPLVTIDEDSSSGGVYGYGQVGTQWISTDTNQAEWYGIKWGIDHPTPGATEDLYNVEFKVYLSFKGRN